MQASDHDFALLGEMYCCCHILPSSISCKWLVPIVPVYFSVTNSFPRGTNPLPPEAFAAFSFDPTGAAAESAETESPEVTLRQDHDHFFLLFTVGFYFVILYQHISQHITHLNRGRKTEDRDHYNLSYPEWSHIDWLMNSSRIEVRCNIHLKSPEWSTFWLSR